MQLRKPLNQKKVRTLRVSYGPLSQICEGNGSRYREKYKKQENELDSGDLPKSWLAANKEGFGARSMAYDSYEVDIADGKSR